MKPSLSAIVSPLGVGGCVSGWVAVTVFVLRHFRADWSRSGPADCRAVWGHFIVPSVPVSFMVWVMLRVRIDSVSGLPIMIGITPGPVMCHVSHNCPHYTTSHYLPPHHQHWHQHCLTQSCPPDRYRGDKAGQSDHLSPRHGSIFSTDWTALLNTQKCFITWELYAVIFCNVICFKIGKNVWCKYFPCIAGSHSPTFVPTPRSSLDTMPADWPEQCSVL